MGHGSSRELDGAWGGEAISGSVDLTRWGRWPCTPCGWDIFFLDLVDAITAVQTKETVKRAANLHKFDTTTQNCTCINSILFFRTTQNCWTEPCTSLPSPSQPTLPFLLTSAQIHHSFHSSWSLCRCAWSPLLCICNLQRYDFYKLG